VEDLAGVTDVLAREQEDDLFGDILGVITNALESLGDED
jgi:hypothetical protein